MSSTSSDSARCGTCGHEARIEMHRSVNANHHKLREALLSGELMTHRCPSCGEVSELDYPLLYHDMARQYLVYLVSPRYAPDKAALERGLPSEADTRSYLEIGPYRFRVVRSLAELVEKIRIFDAGLDDRAIEWVKAVWTTRAANPAGEGNDGQASPRSPAVESASFQRVVDRPDGSRLLAFQPVLRLDEAPELGGLPFTLFWPMAVYEETARSLDVHLPLEAPFNGQWHLVDADFLRARLPNLPKLPKPSSAPKESGSGHALESIRQRPPSRGPVETSSKGGARSAPGIPPQMKTALLAAGVVFCGIASIATWRAMPNPTAAILLASLGVFLAVNLARSFREGG